MKKRYENLRLILGDQLNASHSWYQKVDDDVLYVMFELKQELTYTTHHIQKVCGFFQAMREFSNTLHSGGHEILYLTLNETIGYRDITHLLDHLIDRYHIKSFEYQLPDEYRLDAQLNDYCKTLAISFQRYDSEHFLTQRDDLEQFFQGKKTYLMENFYRHIRRKHDILMDGSKPAGGRWNFDSENRRALPRDHQPIQQLFFNRDVSEIVDMLAEHQISTVGNIDPQDLMWPASRKEALELLEFFTDNQLHNFGNYQDAMTEDDPFIYHSRLSFCLNSKILHPLEVVGAAISKWQDNSETISISQVEGFVRQIIGWREYMRGVYWAKMPGYAACNFFDHNRPLPGFFWTAQTRMNCMHHAIRQSLDHAYAHHIQRLMITGNFALLTGIHPDDVDSWYLGIYIDAIEWVEITNTRGMSQFADGGIVATKPYVSSGNYINKMSHYCQNCHYQVKQKSGKDSCPFNSLYWHFIDRNKKRLEKNPRMGMTYRTWNKMDEEKRQDILETANNFLEKLPTL